MINILISDREIIVTQIKVVLDLFKYIFDISNFLVYLYVEH